MLNMLYDVGYRKTCLIFKLLVVIPFGKFKKVRNFQTPFRKGSM